MRKRGSISTGGILVIGILLLAVFFGGAFALVKYGGIFQQTAGGAIVVSTTEQGIADTGALSACTNVNLDYSTVKFNVYNKANTSSPSSDIYSARGRLFPKRSDGSFSAQNNQVVTDTRSTTTATGESIACGYPKKFCLISSNAEEGNNSGIISATFDGEPLTVTSDKCIEFTPTGYNHVVNIYSSRHGRTKGLMYDDTLTLLDLDGTGAANATSYHSAPASFESTTNAEGITLGEAGSLTYELRLKTVSSDTRLSNHGMYVIFNQSLSKYEAPEPAVQYQSGAYASIVQLKGSGTGTTGTSPFNGLSAKCDDLYGTDNAQEYVFYTDAEIKSTSYVAIKNTLQAKDGQTPATTDDVSIRLDAIQAFDSYQKPGEIVLDACTDESTSAVIQTSDVYSLNIIG